MNKHTEKPLEKNVKEKIEQKDEKTKIETKNEAPKEKTEQKGEESLRPEVKKITVKKWKGKDWFTVLSPKMFNEKKMAETPCTDPKSLIGRVIEVSLGDLTGQPTKHYMKFMFKIIKTENKNATTQFDGYSIIKDFLMRNVRKCSQKVTLISYFDTRDGWRLQITTTSIMNRNTDVNLQKKLRRVILDVLTRDISKSSIDDFVRVLIAGNMQRSIKKEGSKIYPVKFTEIEKVEVIKAGK